MNRWRNTIFGAGLCVMAMAAAPSAGMAQSSFRNYRCADGAQFIVGFFQYDKRAHLQLDGKALTLPKRVALSGSRYQGNGVTLKITKAGVTTLKQRVSERMCKQVSVSLPYLGDSHDDRHDDYT